MIDDEIQVSWRAVVVPSGGAQPVQGYLKRIGKGKAMVKMDYNLPSGHRCSLAVMLPKTRADEPTQFIEGNGVVASSVLSESQFQITLQSLEIKGNGVMLLNEQINKFKEMRKGS